MRNYSRAALLIIMPLVAVFGLISIRTSAQDGNNRQKPMDAVIAVAEYEEAKTFPNSDRLFTLKLTVDDHSPVAATQQDGAMIRLEKEGSWILGLTPYVRDPKTDEIAVKIFQISVVKRDDVAIGEKIVELQTLQALREVDNTTASFTYGDSVFTIQIATNENRFKSDKSNIRIDSQGSSTTCYIACEGIRICACSVEASCGKCCCVGCC